jgi:F-type H+-transporting ATPase subunit a
VRAVGVSPAMYPLLVPLEFFSNIDRPPGHAGPASVLQHVRRPPAARAVRDRWSLPDPARRQRRLRCRPLAWVLAIAISFLELLVQFLQAYVFTLLNAMYISGALADEH